MRVTPNVGGAQLATAPVLDGFVTTATSAARRTLVAIVAAAAALSLAACAGADSTEALWENLPTVQGSEAEPVTDVADLVSRAELVVIGTITNVEVTASTPIAVAGDEAPDFLLVDLKTTLYVTPHGEKEAIPVSISSSIAADLADAMVASIEKAALPQATTVFVLSGPEAGWGYYCTSALAYWCPLEVHGTALRAPRASYWNDVLARDATVSTGDPVADIVAVAKASGVEVRGA